MYLKGRRLENRHESVTNQVDGPTCNLNIFQPKTELNQEYLLRKSQSGPLSDRYTMEKVKIDHSHEGLWSKTVMINKNEL